VMVEGGRVSFELPQSIERELSISVEFEGDRLKAMGADLFVDHWEKLD
jgi:hypothetical protein